MGQLGACGTVLEESQEVSFKVDDDKAENNGVAKVLRSLQGGMLFKYVCHEAILTTKSNQNALCDGRRDTANKVSKI